MLYLPALTSFQHSSENKFPFGICGGPYQLLLPRSLDHLQALFPAPLLCVSWPGSPPLWASVLCTANKRKEMHAPLLFQGPRVKNGAGLGGTLRPHEAPLLSAELQAYPFIWSPPSMGPGHRLQTEPPSLHPPEMPAAHHLPGPLTLSQCTPAVETTFPLTGDKQVTCLPRSACLSAS